MSARGVLNFQMGRGVPVPLGGGGGVKTGPCLKPLGAQEIHPVTVYLTKNLHNYVYTVALLHTSDIPCPIVVLQ